MVHFGVILAGYLYVIKREREIVCVWRERHMTFDISCIWNGLEE